MNPVRLGRNPLYDFLRLVQTDLRKLYEVAIPGLEPGP